jgi:hypothetical protein
MVSSRVGFYYTRIIHHTQPFAIPNFRGLNIQFLFFLFTPSLLPLDVSSPTTLPRYGRVPPKLCGCGVSTRPYHAHDDLFLPPATVMAMATPFLTWTSRRHPLLTTSLPPLLGLLSPKNLFGYFWLDDLFSNLARILTWEVLAYPQQANS